MRKFKTFFNLYSLSKRFLTVILIVVILFFTLTCRLFYLQIIANKNLQALASEQWLRDLPLSSKRGEIYDCNGVSLATTITTYDIYVRAKNVKDAQGLASIISNKLNLDYNNVLKKVTNTGVSEVLIKMQVDENVALELKDYAGVYLSQNVKRVYPYSNLLTQVLGYCTIDNFGQAGLENYYNKYLCGVKGKALTQTNAQGVELENTLTYYLPSVAGADLHTTIDVQMQKILEEELATAYAEHNALNVSGILLNATNGEIKAMSCLPSFDLNNVPRNDIKTLQNLTKNLSVVDVYEPGSTFKLITLAAALNEGLTNLNEHFYCGGRCSVDGETIKCWKTTGHGSQTLVEAFKNSCNCVFVNLALRLGVDKYYEYLKLFGVGAKTGVDISGESSGIIMPKDKVRNVDLARIGFGHAVAVTQLQMASIYAKITTGCEITPHLVESVQTESEILLASQQKSTQIKLKDTVIKDINFMLANNINSEGKYTFVAGYDVGGKTGTAQKYATTGGIAQGKYIASFIGTYPASNPKYVLIICVNEPSNGAYYGGVVAKPVGQRIFTKIFETKVFEPEDESQLNNKPTILMPYLVGKSIAEACGELKKLGLNALFDGDGEIVVEQLPRANTMLYLGEIVYLLTN